MLSAESAIIDGPEDAPINLVLAHGAGAAMDSAFMDVIAAGLAAQGLRVVRFEFPYMAASRRTGKKRPPDRLPILLDTWREVVAQLRREGCERLVIGGKSMGGRIATLVADELAVAAVVCLGYPFHPPSRPEKPRIEHLREIHTPTLILQGERDPFGKPEEVKDYPLADTVQVQWMPDGEHSFKTRKRSDVSEADNLEAAVRAITAFVRALPA